MLVEQIYTGCLAQGAYYIESNGEAAVIDPLREVGAYIEKARKNGATIKYVFETHFHADFVSGHLDLAAKTGATIIYGPNAQTGFEAHIATDGEEFRIGNLTIRVLHTPGHTMESTCYLLFDEKGKEYAVFTGDTLFIGDVGRPDLAQKAANLTKEDLAGMLYESLNNKIKPLPDEVLVYPAHGAGSACGKNMSKETFDVLGHQKATNYALLATSKEQFIEEVTTGLQPPPAYFPQNVALNKGGYESLDNVLSQGMTALAPAEFVTVAEVREALILDVRPGDEFARGHIPGAINIAIDGQFAPWVGALIPDLKQALLLVTPEGQEEETVTRLARVGYDNSIGYLKGGFEAWKAAGEEVDTINRIDAQTFAKHVKIGTDLILDVRKESEYRAEHVEEATNRPLDFINAWTSEINPDQHFYMYCRSGYRSMIAASILKARGIHNFTEIGGGMNTISETDLPRTDYVCQSKIMQA
ncbi:MAG: MBL fold metallo-hydrolase [Bacteroidetes bacterium]|nr:MAG: MBL fold metallo-hydrolase [Bacteroidota bacterium]